MGTRTSRRGTRLLVCLIIAALVVLVDQATKAVIRMDLAVGEAKPLIPGVLELLHVENTGAAFSLGAGAALSSLIFAAVAIAVVVMVLLWVWREELPLPMVMFLGWIVGGGIGNMVDRLAYGSVTDFLATTFVDFPVFNVADIFVTCGVILAFVSYALYAARDRRRMEAIEADREAHPARHGARDGAEGAGGPEDGGPGAEATPDMDGAGAEGLPDD